MLTSAFLSEDDVFRLTGRVRFRAQREALDRLGIAYIASADGRPLVRESALDGRKTRREPRWDLISQ